MPDHQKLEDQIRRRWQADDMQAACTMAIEGYGPEVLSYLMAVLRNEADAGEVFSDFCETVWFELPGFRWQSSFRTWAYTLARHAAVRLFRSPHRRPGRAVPLSQAPEVFAAADRVRTQTLVWLRTEVKDGVAKLRDMLTPDEQSLLILRVDRKMSWDEVACVMLADEDASPAQLSREVVRQRKRYQRLKEKIKKLALAEKIIS